MRIIASAARAGALTLGIAAAMPAGAQQAMNHATFMGSGQTGTLECNGGRAAVAGSTDVLTFTGTCTELQVAGSGNKITIAFGPAAKIEIVGSSNAIAWTGLDGKPPQVSVVGADNTFSPAIQ